MSWGLRVLWEYREASSSDSSGQSDEVTHPRSRARTQPWRGQVLLVTQPLPVLPSGFTLSSEGRNKEYPLSLLLNNLTFSKVSISNKSASPKSVSSAQTLHLHYRPIHPGDASNLTCPNQTHHLPVPHTRSAPPSVLPASVNGPTLQPSKPTFISIST